MELDLSHLLDDTIHISGFGDEDMLWSWMWCPKLILCSVTAELLCLGTEYGCLFPWPSRWKEMVSFTSWIYIFTGDMMAVWVIRYTVNLPISTFVSPLALITTHPHWCLGPDFCVIVAAFMVRQCFWSTLAVRMATVTNQIQSLSFQSSTALAGCCPSTTSSWLASRQGKYVVSFDQSRIT
jgi:hypothetical protein